MAAENNTAKNKDKVRCFYEKVFSQENYEEDFTQENYEAALKVAEEIFTADYVLHYRDGDIEQTVGGPQGIADLVCRIGKATSDLEVSIIDEPMEVEGNRMVTRFEVSGSYGGNPVVVEGMSISQFSETGKITESWAIWESGRMFEQLGVLTSYMDPRDPYRRLRRPLF
jgi:hypothetical protein